MSHLSVFFFFLMIRRPPRSTLFPYNDALPICVAFVQESAPHPVRPHRALPPGALSIKHLARRHVPGRHFQTFAGELGGRSEEHTSELQSQSNLVCRLLLEKKKNQPDIARCIAA